MTVGTVCLLVILGVPLISAPLLFLLRGRATRAAGWLAGLATAVALIGVFSALPSLRSGVVPALSVPWIPDANVRLALRLDWLSLPFLITVVAVTLLAVVYAWGYMSLDGQTPVFYALLMLFAVGMIGTTLADGLFLFYIFWELMLVASCALIAIWGDGDRRGPVALKYFIFTHIGSLLVLVALLLLYDTAGNDGFAALRAGITLAPGLVATVIVLFLLGFSVKMAIFPLHLWLPDAHAVAPMPVTIMLAAAMLSMGTYGVLRFPLGLFSAVQMAPFAVPMMIAGIISELSGALMALAERDVKRFVAYSSVSQMGYILFGLGTLTRDGIAGAVLHVVSHAIVKALLFMGVGLVMRATGRRRLSDLGGLGRTMPLVAFCTGLGALAIAGTPPFCIFASEWMVFAGGLRRTSVVLPLLAVFGSLLTVAYALWFVGRLFFGPQPEDLQIKQLPRAMVAPMVLLTALTLIVGLFPAPVLGWVDAALGLILGGGW